MHSGCVEPQSDSWKPSRFNASVPGDNGAQYFYNSFAGALVRVPAGQIATVNEVLVNGLLGFPQGMFAELALGGFLVPADFDELRAAAELHASQFGARDVLQLILMPNENCNFRCVYCYESFARNKMKRDVIEGIVSYVRSRISELSVLRIGWFGGEPLTAPEIIEELSTRLQEICAKDGVEYASSMTTNGYLLTPQIAKLLFRASIRRFQITLDGPRDVHNRQRLLADGRTGTFDRILENLTLLREQNELFRVVIRANIAPQSIPEMSGFLQMLQDRFGGDGRYSTDFHAVGHWGGPNDSALKVFDTQEGRARSLDFAKQAVAFGFDATSLRKQLKPFGAACYAANPYSFVIGSDGTVYKCTVAFDDPRNQVGVVTSDGHLVLDAKKLLLWVANGEEGDLGCQKCWFRPACQGNACPLARLNHGRAVCPSTVAHIDGALQVLGVEMQGALGMQTSL